MQAAEQMTADDPATWPGPAFESNEDGSMPFVCLPLKNGMHLTGLKLNKGSDGKWHSQHWAKIKDQIAPPQQRSKPRSTGTPRTLPA